MKKLGIFLLLCVVLLFISNRVYDANKEPEITGSFSILASASPNKIHMIELQEMYAVGIDGFPNGSGGGFHSFRIYYGGYGSLLENYKEIMDIRMSDVDYFEVVWTDDEHANINVMLLNRTGENVMMKTYEFDFLNQTLTKQAD